MRYLAHSVRKYVMPNLSNKVKFGSAIFIVIALFSVSYWNFSSYQPKALTELREVKGYKTSSQSELDLPYPRYATGVANDETSNSKKFTFKTDRSPEQIQSFYENLLLEEGWRLKKEGSIDNFYTAEYRRDDLSISVWASFEDESNLTFASVEISRVN